ncbi:MAG TPA: radical SAM protein, partial [Candidatus Tumulicola sp.]
MIGLAYCDAKGRIYYDETTVPLADGGLVRETDRNELIPAPEGIVAMILPGRRPLTTIGPAGARYALAAILPAGYTRLLVPAYVKDRGAPDLPLFGYTFACAIDDRLHVAATKTDEDEDWQPRSFAAGQLEGIVERRVAEDPGNRVLRQVALCAREYGCFTAQNVFLERGEAALPVSPKCNARCVGCISEQEPEAALPSPQTRIAYEVTAGELARVGIHHLERVDDGIVSFGQGCEGEPLLRSIEIAAAIRSMRAARPNGTINLNTNGSLPTALARCIDAGLGAVRVSLNSFRPAAYAAYYRPQGYDLDDVFESIRLAVGRGLRTSLNLLTHPGVTDDEEELAAMEAFLREVPVTMVQTRTL